MLSCKRYAALLAPFAEEELPVTDRERVAAHVAACASCREAVETHRIMAALLSTHRPAAPEPAADLWSRIEAEIASAGQAAVRESPARRPWLPSLPLQLPRFRVAMPAATGLVAAGLTLLFLFTGTNNGVVARRKAVHFLQTTLVGPRLDSASKSTGSSSAKPSLIVDTPIATTVAAADLSAARPATASKTARTAVVDNDPFLPLEKRRRVASAYYAASARTKAVASASSRRAQMALADEELGDIKAKRAIGPPVLKKQPGQRSQQTAALGTPATSMALSMVSKTEQADRARGFYRSGIESELAPDTMVSDVPDAVLDATLSPKAAGEAGGPPAPAVGSSGGGIAAVRPDAPGIPSHPAVPAAATPEIGTPEEGSPAWAAVSAPVSVLGQGKVPTARASAVDAATRANRQRTLFSYGNR